MFDLICHGYVTRFLVPMNCHVFVYLLTMSNPSFNNPERDYLGKQPMHGKKNAKVRPLCNASTSCFTTTWDKISTWLINKDLCRNNIFAHF